MKNSKLIVAAAAAVSAMLGISAASAADLPIKGPPTVAAPLPFSWTGFYIGGHGGYGWRNTSVNISLDGDPTNDAESVPRLLNTSPSGFIGGGQTGYNVQTGILVFGIEADISYARIKGKASAAPVIAGFDIKTTTAEQDVDWFGTARGRVGLAPFDRSLFYVTGGLAYGHVTLSNSIVSQSIGCAGGGFCTAASTSKTSNGWTAGGGWENMLTNNLSAKAEYLYYNLGSISQADPPTGGVVFRVSNGEFKGNIVRFGLNYKLGCAGGDRC